jgi:hypothetical protein
MYYVLNTVTLRCFPLSRQKIYQTDEKEGEKKFPNKIWIFTKKRGREKPDSNKASLKACKKSLIYSRWIVEIVEEVCSRR